MDLNVQDKAENQQIDIKKQKTSSYPLNIECLVRFRVDPGIIRQGYFRKLENHAGFIFENGKEYRMALKYGEDPFEIIILSTNTKWSFY